jgi:hypothetical protein
MTTTTSEQVGTLSAGVAAAAAVALQVWLARRLARATEHATDVEDTEMHVAERLA